jgi:hypothetical protein
MDKPTPIPISKSVRAAQYVRMSTEHQQYSTENQAEVIARYAAEHGMEIVAISAMILSCTTTLTRVAFPRRGEQWTTELPPRSIEIRVPKRPRGA